MKKLILTLIAITALMAVSCKHEDPKVDVKGVNLSKTTLEMVIGESQSLTATITPADATDKTLTWSSGKSDVATVDQSGKVTAVAPGTTTITVKSANGKSASCTVTVKEKSVPVTAVTLDKNEVTLTEGSNITLTATIAPDNATNKEVTWESSNTEIATVDQEGNVEAIAAGKVAITVVSKQDVSKKATCIITVEELLVAVESVSLDKSEADMFIGKLLTLTATISPINASNQNVIWSSSDETIATVDQNGNVSAVAEGEAIITATTSDGGKIASCTINVLPIPVEGVSLDKTEAEIILSVAPKVQLTAIIAPEDASNKSVTWSSSDETVATVDATGEVTAVAVGEATITVTTADGGKTATCKINVSPVPISAVTIIPATITINDGEVEQLDLEFTPAESTASKDVEWGSSNESVVTVDETGKITGKGAGSANVQVRLKSNNEIKATCKVTVEKDATLKGIALNKTNTEIQVGDSEQLTVAYTPTYAANKTVSWTSSNSEVATVDASGNITAVAIGEATITATSEEGDFTAACAVKVVEKTVDIYHVDSDGVHKNGILFFRALNEPKLFFDDENEYILKSSGYYSNEQIGLFKNGSFYFEIKPINSGERITHCNMALDPTTSEFYIIYYSSLARTFDRVAKLSSDKTLTEIEIESDEAVRSFSSIVATTFGDIIIFGSETDAFNTNDYYIWKIDSNGIVTKTAVDVPAGYRYSNLAVDNLGNYYYALTGASGIDLYKNGNLEYSVNDHVMRYSLECVYINGSDSYVLCHDDGYDTSVRLYKNGTLFKTFSFGGHNVQAQDFAVSSKGDVYVTVAIVDSNPYTGALYRNEDYLYDFNPSRGSYITIKE